MPHPILILVTHACYSGRERKGKGKERREKEAREKGKGRRGKQEREKEERGKGKGKGRRERREKTYISAKPFNFFGINRPKKNLPLSAAKSAHRSTFFAHCAIVVDFLFLFSP